MNDRLYQDFKLTKDNCDSEPIYRPIAIQGHGHMLVFDRDDLSVLLGVSDQCHSLFDLAQKSLWAAPASQWLPHIIWETLTRVVEAETDHGSTVGIFHVHNNQSFEVLIHTYDKCAVIEFEPKAKPLALNFSDIQRVAKTLSVCDSTTQLYESTAKAIKQMLKYDRVMIYKFDHDHHGHVVGEAKEDHLEPFLGLHYPSTDIPPMARAIFLLNKSRMIQNIDQKNSWLVFNPAVSASPPYLNLSMSELRATSPIHIEYLKNMGVQATLTLALVVEDKLWGLVACHHYSERAITYNERKLGETMADLFSLNINQIHAREIEYKIQASTKAREQVLEKIRFDDYYKIELLDNCSTLLNICQCDGAAIYSTSNSYSSSGLAPDKNTMAAIVQWIIQDDIGPIYSTDHLSSVLPNKINLEGEIGGMLMTRISDVTESYIFWFRKPQRQIVSWAGDPNNAVVVNSSAKTGEVTLSPRASFDKWQQVVDDKSHAWPEYCLSLAQSMRKAILTKEFERTAKRVMRSKNELEQLVYAASHDLQEPIRTQLNFLGLLQEEIETADTDELKFFIERSMKSAKRMQLLISDLLEYSRVGNLQERLNVALEDIVNEIKEDLDDIITHKNVTITTNTLPTFIGTYNEIKQLFTNFITNAIKYVAPGTRPTINIQCQSDGDYVNLSFTDNGIGIEGCYFEKIFLMFQRLHVKDEYEGTGIGLALCKKVADNYDATISVASSLESGSTFTVRFHKSCFAEEKK